MWNSNLSEQLSTWYIWGDTDINKKNELFELRFFSTIEISKPNYEDDDDIYDSVVVSSCGMH